MKRLLFILFIVLGSFLYATQAQATALSTAAAACAVGQFCLVSGMTNLQATANPGFDPCIVTSCTPGPGYDGSQPAWDSATKKLYIQAAEHGAGSLCPENFPNYPNVCWKKLWTYDDTTSTWVITGPNPAYTSGGGPVGTFHVYGKIAWDDVNKTIYVKDHNQFVGGNISFFRYCATNSPATYCASQLGQWSQITSFVGNAWYFGQLGWHPTLAGPKGGVGTLLYFEEYGGSGNCGALHGYTEGEGWRTIDAGTSPACKFPRTSTANMPAVRSTSKGVVIFGPTGASGLQWWRINSAGTITALDAAPCPLFATDGGFGQMTEDPVTGNIILIGCTNAGQMWRLNPTGATGSQWTQMHATLNAPGQICNQNRNGTTNCGFDFYASPISTYGVIGFWKYKSDKTAEYWIYKATATGGGDIVAPTVSMTAPANGATVSGAATTVSATASDNVGVAGVQFKLDGANLGAEDTTSPYSISWNTTTASNGSHTITAVARDAAGNSTTSTGVTVTVSNAGGSDFSTRCNAAGVFFCNGFDSAGDLGGDGWGNARGHAPSDGTQFCGANNCPTIDTTNKVSGAGSMKFTMPPGTNGNAAGGYWANPSTDFSVRFGAGQTWYVQFRQKVTASYFTVAATNNKIHWVSSRPDLPGCSTSNTSNCFSTCTENELVNQNQYPNPSNAIPRWYTACPGANNFEFILPVTPGQYNLENGRTAPGCLYDNVVAGNIFPPNGNCFPYSPDQWVTWSYKITLGSIGTGTVGGQCFDASIPSIPTNKQNCYYGGQFQARAGLDGQPLTEVLNWTGPMVAKDQTDPTELRYGKVFFAPYTASATIPAGAAMWFDELIMSTQPIADPSTADTTIPTVAITSPIPPTTSTTTSPIAVSGTATDNVSVTSVTWTCVACVTKGGTATSSPGASISWLIPALDLGSSAGSFILNVVAHDAAGNVSTAATLNIAYAPVVTYWVSTSGSNSNGCTSTATPQTTGAKLTIAAGLTCLTSGATLNIRGGTYTEFIQSSNLTNAQSGAGSGNTYSAPTTIQAYSNEVVTLNNASGCIHLASPGTGQTRSYYIFKNLICDGVNSGGSSPPYGISIGGGNNGGTVDRIKFDGMQVTGWKLSAVQLGGDDGVGTNTWFTNGYVHDNGTIAGLTLPGDASPSYGHCWYVEATTIIENSRCTNQAGYGIHQYAGINNSNHIYRNNIITRTGLGDARSSSGIALVSGDNSLVYNNIVSGNFGGIGVASSNHKIYNNTIYASGVGYGGACCYPAIDLFGSTNAIVQNNLLVSNQVNTVDTTNATGPTVDHNVTSTSPSTIFIDAPNGNFHLRASATVAINTGTTTISVPSDIIGTARPQGSAYDIGAYEFIGTIPPVVTIISPTSNPTLGVTSPIFSLGGTSNLP